jgi:hypothetical protein
VPQMKVGSGADDMILVDDSEPILHWFDDNMQTGFFPNKLASDLSVRVSGKTVAAMVWYYNWVDDSAL